MRVVGLFAFVGFVGLCLLHCSGPTPGALPKLDTCLSNADCSGKERCLLGACSVQSAIGDGSVDAAPIDSPASDERSIDNAPRDTAQPDDTRNELTPDNVSGDSISTDNAPDKACQPSPEICDGKDNNCDGKIDETFPNQGKACKVSGKLGPCEEGLWSCDAGSLSCQQVNQPGTEICGNAKDDDCDGQVDENPPCICQSGSTQSCYTGNANQVNVGICRAGLQKCQGGRWGACEGEVRSSAETCDNQDNDCNGKIDDFSFSPPIPCQRPLDALGHRCPDAETQCNAGKRVCPNVNPSSKTLLTALKNSTYPLPGKLQPCQPAGLGTMFGVSVDTATGRVYFTDRQHHLLRMYDPATLKVTTIAGIKGTAGYADGEAGSAKFNSPAGVRFAKGSIYVADSQNHIIRRVHYVNAGNCGSRNGYTGYCVSTFAGQPQQGGYQNGAATTAKFSRPQDMAFNAKGELLVADSGNHSIRKVAVNGVVGTFAGTGSAGSPSSAFDKGNNKPMHWPNALAIDKNDNVYVSEQNNHIIRKITASGYMTVLAGVPRALGHFDTSNLSASRLNAPVGVALDAAERSLYVSDRGNFVIRRIDLANNTISTVVGSPRDRGFNEGGARKARLQSTQHIALDAKGRLLITEANRRTMRLYHPDPKMPYTSLLFGHWNVTQATDGDALCASLTRPQSLVLGPKGMLYFTISAYHSIFRIDLAKGMVEHYAGNALAKSDNGTRFSASFNYPYGLAFDKAGNLYVSCHGDHRIRKIDTSNNVTTFAGSVIGWFDANRPTFVRFNKPSGMVFDKAGNLYVADHENHLIRKVTFRGATSTFAGWGRAAGSADGKGSSARFRKPLMLAIDARDALYVTDVENRAIRKVDAGRNVTTMAGGSSGYAEGVGKAAKFNFPWGIAILPNGSFLISDIDNHRLRRMTPGRAVSTYLGAAGQGQTDGDRSKAQLSKPTGLVYDAKTAAVYWFDYNPARLRKLSLCTP